MVRSQSAKAKTAAPCLRNSRLRTTHAAAHGRDREGWGRQDEGMNERDRTMKPRSGCRTTLITGTIARLQQPLATDGVEQRVSRCPAGMRRVPERTTAIAPADYAKIAEASGWEGITVKTRAAFRGALKKGLDSGRRTMIEAWLQVEETPMADYRYQPLGGLSPMGAT